MPRTPPRLARRAAPRSIAHDTPRPQPDGTVPEPEPDTPQPESRMNQIARRAHEIYEARNGNHGTALEDWLQAEREIDDAQGETER